MAVKWKNLIQFIKFGLVGVSNTLISEGVYFIVVLFGGNYLIASVLGFIISVLNAYYWSSKYVFKEQEDREKRVWWKVLLKTYVAYFWGFLVNAILLVFWIELIQLGQYMQPAERWLTEAGIIPYLSNFGIELNAAMLGEITAPIINLIITIPMNYFINKYWAYKQKKYDE